MASCAAGRGGAFAGARTGRLIPTIRQVLGHDFGDKVTTPEEIPIYLRALHQAAPDRARLTEYARSSEGRPLWLFVIASPQRIAARDQLARKAYLIHQAVGQGHVVAFAEDPNFRAFTKASQLLFINAVLLGPAR